MVQSSDNSTNQPDLGYEQIFKIIFRRKWVLIPVFMVIVSLMTAKALKQEPIYESSMQLLIESNYQDKKGSKLEEILPESNLEIDYSSQLILMRSSQLLEKVIKLLHGEYPALTVQEIKDSLTVNQVLEEETKTKIFAIKYTSNDPAKTQDILFGLQEIYQEYNSRQQDMRLENGLGFINEQILSISDRLIESQSKLEKFRQEHNLIDPIQEASDLLKTLNSIQQERYSVTGELQETQGRYDQIEQSLNLSPKQAIFVSRLSQSIHYQNILQELQVLEIELLKRRAMFLETDSGIKILKNKREELIKQLEQEVAQLLIEASFPPETSSETILSQGKYSQNELLLIQEYLNTYFELEGLKQKEQSLLQSEVELNQKRENLQSLVTSYNKLNLEVEALQGTLAQLIKSQQDLGIEINREGFEWQIIEPPQSGTQIGPDLKQDLLLAIIVSSFLGGASAFIAEFLDDRINQIENIQPILDLPILGSISLLSKASFRYPWQRKTKGIKSTKTAIEEDWERLNSDFYLLWRKIQKYLPSQESNAILITSVLTDKGQSNLILGLGITAVCSNQKVLIIDADVDSPCLHQFLELSSQKEPESSLTTQQIIDSIMTVTLAQSQLDILPGSQIFKNTTDFEKILRELEQVYQLIIVSAPPIIGKLDTIYITSICSGTILLLKLGQVKKAQLTEIAKLVDQINAIGIIVNE
jgi:succinoglycan biosynthesis transport protein ExoP